MSKKLNKKIHFFYIKKIYRFIEIYEHCASEIEPNHLVSTEKLINEVQDIESSIGLTLFEMINNKFIPTRDAHEYYLKIIDALKNIELPKETK